MIKYSESKKCRRKQILEYFGEEYNEENCGSCDICLEEKETSDITELTKDILTAIDLTKGFFGTNYIINLLHGHKDSKEWHKRYYFYGKLQDTQKEELREIIENLIQENLIKKSEGKYPTLSLTFEGKKFLDDPHKIEIEKSITKIEKTEDKTLDYDKDLFEKLRDLRKKVAQTRGVPPFVIFGDETLREMSHYKPQTREEFLRIKGVGEAKLDFFGKEFLELIINHK
jgi:ATP-dependent DNA helicase RecQ